MLERAWRKGNLVRCWWKYIMVTITMGNSIEIPSKKKKKKNRAPMRFQDFTPGWACLQRKPSFQKTQAPQQCLWHYLRKPLSPCATTTEPALCNPKATTTDGHLPRAHTLWPEKPPQWEACEPQGKVAPNRHSCRKPMWNNEDLVKQKTNKK